jgi:hypothetical protein
MSVFQLRVAFHVPVPAHQAGSLRNLAEPNRTSETARSFLSYSEHQKLLQEVQHSGLLPLDNCKAGAIDCRL